MNYTHLRALARLELPDPVPGGLPVQDHLQDLPLALRVVAFERCALGVERYGVPLAALDGRGPVDALQEAGDLVAYLRREALGGDAEAAAILDDLVAPLSRLVAWAVERVPAPGSELV